MDAKEFCCEDFALAFYQRQICFSMDEDGGWNVRVDAFNYALENIRFCPFCGSHLPTEVKSD
jgi:hypothetical protein